MTQNKDFKRRVRARMHKTGEAYTAARAQLLTRSTRPTTFSNPAPTDMAKIAGMSDEKVKAATGCTWQRWVRALDKDGAAELSHRDIARHIAARYKTPSWWTQTVTVGYERIKGLRTRGQQRDGSFGFSKSRTYPVPVATLFDAWASAAMRRRWLDEGSSTVRSKAAPKSLRLALDKDQSVAVTFTAKGSAKSAVTVELLKLPDRDTANRLKEFWSDRFDALKTALAAERSNASSGVR